MESEILRGKFSFSAAMLKRKSILEKIYLPGGWLWDTSVVPSLWNCTGGSTTNQRSNTRTKGGDLSGKLVFSLMSSKYIKVYRQTIIHFEGQ